MTFVDRLSGHSALWRVRAWRVLFVQIVGLMSFCMSSPNVRAEEPPTSSRAASARPRGFVLGACAGFAAAALSANNPAWDSPHLPTGSNERKSDWLTFLVSRHGWL